MGSAIAQAIASCFAIKVEEEAPITKEEPKEEKMEVEEPLPEPEPVAEPVPVPGQGIANF